MDMKNPGGEAPAKSLIYMAENSGGEGGEAPPKSLKLLEAVGGEQTPHTPYVCALAGRSRSTLDFGRQKAEPPVAAASVGGVTP